MFVHKISSVVNFGRTSLANNNKDNNKTVHKSVNNSTPTMSNSQRLDLLVKKMNALQLDVEKMRARQMLSDRIVTTGKLNLISKDCNKNDKQFGRSIESLNKIC